MALTPNKYRMVFNLFWEFWGNIEHKSMSNKISLDSLGRITPFSGWRHKILWVLLLKSNCIHKGGRAAECDLCIEDFGICCYVKVLKLNVRFSAACEFGPIVLTRELIRSYHAKFTMPFASISCYRTPERIIPPQLMSDLNSVSLHHVMGTSANVEISLTESPTMPHLSSLLSYEVMCTECYRSEPWTGTEGLSRNTEGGGLQVWQKCICRKDRMIEYCYHDLKMRGNIVLGLSGRGVTGHPGGRLTAVHKISTSDPWRLGIQDLIQVQGDTVHSVASAQMYVDTARLNHRGASVSVSEGHVHIERNGKVIYSKVRQDSMNQSDWDKLLRHIRHDYVANCLRGSTDKRFTDVGINSILSPDYIDMSRRSCLELATNASDADKSLQNSYNKKVLAYMTVCEANNMEQLVLVVSMTKILSNMEIPGIVVSELCLRMREAMSIEQKMSEVLGRNIQDDDDSDDTLRIREYKDALLRITKLKRNQSWCFNSELAEESTREMSQLEMDWIANASKNAWNASFRKRESVDFSAVPSYLESMRRMSTRMRVKRVQPFVMFIPRVNEIQDNYSFEITNIQDSCAPPEVLSLWMQALRHYKMLEPQLDPKLMAMRSLEDAIKGESTTKIHETRKNTQFHADLSESEIVDLAKRGPNGKRMSENESVKRKELESKIGFDPDVDVDDIESFLNSPDGIGHKGEIKQSQVNRNILKLLREAKGKGKRHRSLLSIDMFNQSLNHPLCQHSAFVTSLCLELSYVYKVPDPPSTWTIRKMRDYECYILSQSTGTHVHFSLCFRKSSSLSLETGRLGPDTWAHNDIIMTDFSSLVEESLDHYIKAGPYTVLKYNYLLEHFRVPVIGGRINPPPSHNKTLRFLYLMFLNNKIDVEELVTSCRYLYMRVLQETNNDPNFFVERLPNVLRSRFSALVLKRVLNMMAKFESSPPKLVINRSRKRHGNKEIYYVGLRSIFHSDPVTLEQCVDSFYFGYVVSKSKGKVGDRSFKVMGKLLKEEFWYQDNLRAKDECLWSLRDQPKKHCWSTAYLKHCCDNWMIKMVKLHGSNFKSKLETDILNDWSRQNFEDIATLKASARDILNTQLDLPSKYSKNTKGRDYVKALKEANSQLRGKRPRVLSQLLKLIEKAFQDQSDGMHGSGLARLLNFSITKLSERGWLYCDLFPKDQHGGDREIHVLEIMARVCQFHIERVSRVVCRYFQTDSIVHPKVKDTFMRDHETAAQAKLGDHTTLCKSADATKWCQRNHASRFFFLMNRLTSGVIESFLYQFWYLWTKKRAIVSPELIAILDTSEFVEESNPDLIRLKRSFKQGAEPFFESDSFLVGVESGMWQGIPHITSTLNHSCIQEHARDYCQLQMEQKGFSCIVSVIQGSDDSACAISFVPDKDGVGSDIARACLYWKEEMAKHSSIWTSEAKSSIGTRLMIEYNSEWWFCGKIIKPTFRWVSASLNMTITDSFYERYSTFYNQMSQCVTYGLSCLSASIIQLCQGWLHYIALGFQNHLLSDTVCNDLLQSKNPALGYFLTDMDSSAGMGGFNLSLLKHVKDGNIEVTNVEAQEDDPLAMIEYEGKVDKSVKKSLSGYRLRMGDYKLHQALVEDLGMDILEESIEFFNSRPSELYGKSHDWDVEKHKVVLKLFSPGVKSSLSSYQPNIRSVVASSYTFNRKCMSIKGTNEKMSLLQCIRNDISTKQDSKKPKTDSEMTVYFPHYDEMKEALQFMESLDDSWQPMVASMTKKHKVDVILWGTANDGSPTLIDLCKKKWWNMNSVPVARRTFEELWRRAKVSYPFLRDRHEETARLLKMDSVSLHNLLLSTQDKVRSMRLYDTEAKYPTYQSAITRTFWPSIKLIGAGSSATEDFKTLRHEIFSVLSSFLSLPKKKQLVIDILAKAACLNSDIAKLPRRVQIFKILRDVILGKTPDEILADLDVGRLGVIGYFTKRQQYDVIRKGGLRVAKSEVRTHTGKMVSRMIGEGEWHGRIGSTSVKIMLEGNKVKLIEVSKIVDALNLSKSLSELVTAIKGNFLGEPNSSPSLLYLSSSGYFQSSPTPLIDHLPVRINQGLTMHELSAVDLQSSYILVENTTLKLCKDLELLDKAPVRVVICSVTVTVDDWNPGLHVSQERYPAGSLMENWLKGKPIQITELISETLGSLSNQDLDSLYTELMDKKTRYKEIGDYDVVQLRSLVRTTLLGSARQVIEQSFLKMPPEVGSKNVIMDEDTRARMERLVELDENPLSIEMIQGMKSHVMWADVQEDEWVDDSSHDHLDDEEVVSQDELEMMDTERVLEIKDILYGQDMSHIEKNLVNFAIKTMMPVNSRFFSGLTMLLDMEKEKHKILGMVADERMLSKINFSTPIHRLISLVMCADVNNITDAESSRLSAIAEMSESSLIRHEGQDAEKRIKDLEESKLYLERAVIESPDVLKPHMQSSLEKVISELNRLRSPDPMFKSVINDFWQFMNILVKQLETTKQWDRTDIVTTLEEKVMLLRVAAKERASWRHTQNLISSEEKNRRFSVIDSSNLNGLFLFCMADALGLEIFIYREGCDPATDDPVLSAQPSPSKNEIDVFIPKSLK